MSGCPCPDCITPDRVGPIAEIDLRWRAWSAAVLDGRDQKAEYDRYLHPATRVATESIGVTR